VFIIHGSQRSSGVSIGYREMINYLPMKLRFIGKVTTGALGQITLPPKTNILPEECVAAVWG
jgi:hypothetical protein